MLRFNWDKPVAPPINAPSKSSRTLALDLTGSVSSDPVRSMSKGFICWAESAETVTTVPPRACANGTYSCSGSMITTRSWESRTRCAISAFADWDLPDPVVPRMKPFEFICAARSTTTGLPLLSFTP